ncbi:hypothetical protein Y032_0304g1914 [Ancylostoma ceylanicum]|uniref:Uncharacterized protein n=1 Tax=Ancylostoma ceylanicum TaxID=53326 RepID=A0A016S458_9BILA|nr:hypothetical protein Y032_0304g1914 [Ancylostoma ceylanicum]
MAGLWSEDRQLELINQYAALNSSIALPVSAARCFRYISIGNRVYHREGKEAWPGDSDWRTQTARHAQLFQLKRRHSRNTWSICAWRRRSSNRWALWAARVR